jgi:hypothetical protein
MDAVRAVLRVGSFQDTLPLADDVGVLSLTHIDADLYASVLEACEWAYPRTRTGGMIVFDDYGFADCPGASRAITDRPPNWPSTGREAGYVRVKA